MDSIEKRLILSRQMGADEVIDFSQEDPVAAIKRLTEGRGVDVAIEALGRRDVSGKPGRDPAWWHRLEPRCVRRQA